MSARVRVTLDDEGAVAVKVASGDAEVARLHREADRLRQAGHPGVVELLDVTPIGGGAELRTRFAGEPLDRWQGSLASVAGIGAAVAATLADLHGLGVVHGRIDASHILIGADGRPRLCGMSGRDDAVPADDVAALAGVLDHLATTARPSRRRRAGVERRAMAAQLGDARDSVAERRSTPTAFARALLAAVPDADLPPSVPGPSSPMPPSPDDHGDAGHDGDTRHTRGTRDGSHTGKTGDPADDTAEFDDFWSGPPDLERFDDDLGPPIGHPADVLAADHPIRPARALFAGASRHLARAPGRPVAPASPDRGERDARRHRRIEPGIVVAGLALAVGAGGAAVALALGGDSGHEVPPPRAGTTAGEAATAAGACPPTPAPAADVDGDGCAERVRVDDRTVTAGGARWALGEPGDLVAVGDWDCDGGATAALLRPGTGEVFVFPGWAPAGQPITVPAVDRVRDAVDIRAEPGGDRCDRLLVERATGGTTAVGPPGEVAAGDPDGDDGDEEDR